MAQPVSTQPPQEAPATGNGIPRETRLTLIGIMLGMFLAALDQTIVSTALPRIIADLNGSNLYAWVTTAYLLTSTIAAPIFGRLTEIYSRKVILMIAVVIFLAGSALCGLSQNMVELIAFRGIQGIGGGALFALAFTTIAYLFPPRERGRIGGLFGAVFGLSSAVGPWLGGLLTDHISWHWVFYINMPVGAVALWFILRYMPRMRPEERQPFDYIGAVLLMGWTVPLMLGFSWAGSSYAWNSPVIVGLFAASAAMLALWVWSQTHIKHPLFDLSILQIRTFSLSAVAAFFFGPAFLGAIAFLPLYLQMVKGVSASASGVTVLPLTAGVIIGAMGSGILSGRIGRYKPILLVGTLWLLAVFLVLHFVIQIETPLWLAIVLFTLLGLGLGPAQSLLQTAAQNNVPPQRIGSATSAIQFVRQIGATIGVAVLGTVLSSNIHTETCKLNPADASCKPGAVVTRSGEGSGFTDFKKLETNIVAALKGDHSAYVELMNDKSLPAEQKKGLVDGGIPAQFAAIEAKVVAATKGDLAAYKALMSDPTLPQQLRSQLVEGGIPAQVHAQSLQTLSALEKALRGDAAAKAALLANPQLPAQLKGLLAGPTPPAAAIAGIVEQVRKGLEAAEPGIVARVEAQAIPQIRKGLQEAEARALVEVPAKLVQQLEEVRMALETGITKAEQDIFLYAAFFVLMSLLVTLFLPNEMLKGGFGGGRGEAQAPAAH
ncbi:MAG: MDR family MFS transporter [Meiothermus sp.]|nr:MDR family MFS transporter [Meiothermus sp.]